MLERTSVVADRFVAGAELKLVLARRVDDIDAASATVEE